MLPPPGIYLKRKVKGKKHEDAAILHQDPTKEPIESFYKSCHLTLSHIISRVAMIYDQTGSISPLLGYGNQITRLAQIDTKGEVTTQVNKDIRIMFLDLGET